jgi:hypothetical protein
MSKDEKNPVGIEVPFNSNYIHSGILHSAAERLVDAAGMEMLARDAKKAQDLPPFKINFKDKDGRVFSAMVTPEKAFELAKEYDIDAFDGKKKLTPAELSNDKFKSWLSPTTPTEPKKYREANHPEDKTVPETTSGIRLSPDQLHQFDRPYVIQANTDEEKQKARGTAEKYLESHGVTADQIKLINDKGETQGIETTSRRSSLGLSKKVVLQEEAKDQKIVEQAQVKDPVKNTAEQQPKADGPKSAEQKMDKGIDRKKSLHREMSKIIQAFSHANAHNSKTESTPTGPSDTPHNPKQPSKGQDHNR